MQRTWRVLGLGLALAAIAVGGCRRAATSHDRSLRFRGNNADVYLRSVAATLNDLPNALDLELLPAQPILTASLSADGNEVTAICISNPQTPGGPINFLQVVTGNANFATLQVRAGDIVRYYIIKDEEALERNLVESKAVELHVRRLDVRDPENALILDEEFPAPIEIPQRIEIWRYSDKRTDAIRSMLQAYEVLRRPPAGWEPSADLAALRQIVERANQWLLNEGSEGDADPDSWRVDPLLAGVPQELRSDPALAKLVDHAALRNGVFADWEGRLLEQAVWCRDIAQWARGEALSDLDAVSALFDWTIRNIQLAPRDGARLVHHPWQALVYGHGTAEHRGWVFAELCRQQGIEVVALQPRGGPSTPLLMGALVDGQLYLFDPALGLPLPGAEGGVASLAAIAEQPDLLRQLDLPGGPAYPLTAEQLADVEALVIASPLQLARRSARLERALEGEEFVKLAADASAIAERATALPHVAGASLWTRPFQAVVDEFTARPSVRRLATAEFEPFAQRPLLWKARILHFQGNKQVRADQRSDPLAEPRLGHNMAVQLYQDRTVRPPDSLLAPLDQAKQAVYQRAKAASSYWVALLSYDLGRHDIAASWLRERTLDREPRGTWAPGARYNLARTYEAQGRLADAITLLRSDPRDAPQRTGNLIRAQQLEARLKQASQDDADGAADSPSVSDG